MSNVLLGGGGPHRHAQLSFREKRTDIPGKANGRSAAVEAAV